MKRSTLVVSMMVALPLVAAACKKKEEQAKKPDPAGTPTPGGSGTTGPTPPAGPDKEKLEGEVEIIAWTGYITRGDIDPAYDWVTGFEKETGCKVKVKTAATSDEMVALMNAGTYDLVTASGDASLRLIAGKKVQPVDLKRIPSYANVDPRLKDAPWYTVDGKHYGVPYQWGPNVLLYNTKVFKEAPKSWSVTFEEQKLPDGKSNKGRIQAFDGSIYVADAALYLMKKKPDLGITDPYELDEKQYAAALEVLRNQHKLVQKYWHDAFKQIADVKTEGVAATGSWGFMANALKAGGAPVAWTIPEEGTTGWADTTMMHVNAKHPNCAYKWMEHSLNPTLQISLSEFFGSVPAVPDACKGKAPKGTDACKINGFDNFEKIKFWKTPQATCKQGTCVPYSKWLTDYAAIMGGK